MPATSSTAAEPSVVGRNGVAPEPCGAAAQQAGLGMLLGGRGGITINRYRQPVRFRAPMGHDESPGGVESHTGRRLGSEHVGGEQEQSGLLASHRLLCRRQGGLGGEVPPAR